MAAVGIIALGAEGGDLQHLGTQDHADGAMLFTGTNQTVIGKNGSDLLRRCGGAQVIVMGRKAQASIPDAAAHGVNRKASLFQTADAISRVFR